MKDSESTRNEFELLISSITNEVLKSALYENVDVINKEMITMSGKIENNLNNINNNVVKLSNLQVKLSTEATAIENSSEYIKENANKLDTFVKEIILSNKESLLNYIKECIDSSLNKYHVKINVLLGLNILLSIAIIILILS